MSRLVQPAAIDTVRHQFAKANPYFDEHAVVLQNVGQRLLERLELLNLKPEHVLELGCRSGYQLSELAQRYPDAQIIGVDPAPGFLPSVLPGAQNVWRKWLRRGRRSAFSCVACDPHKLPFADQSFDLIVSNLLLPWCHAPHLVFAETVRVLRSGGAFLFTSAGPDTLHEYRAAWQKVDNYTHSFGLIDMHDLGDSMMAAGFDAPVLDRENLLIQYPSINALQSELRHLGAANIAQGRRKGLMSPRVQDLLAQTDLSGSSAFDVTFELLHGHGWKTQVPLAGRVSDSEYRVSADSLRGSWKAGSCA
ncbi:MAG: methyltransferase domain-containing protein [Granulosicoccus sp.]|nr:methyltransferase domain-containing protein [Granulosicoccus sp.]